MIVPIYKKGKQEVVENYRGISLLCTAYKIYAEILRNRSDEEVERRELLPENQCGFRRGRGTMDNIFVLNHLVQGIKKDKDFKFYALFVDLKAAFDNVDRRKLWDILEEKGINQKIISRLMDIYEDTETAVRTEERLARFFRTTKGVRQGCAMSPLLFNLRIADLDNFMKWRNIGGVDLEKDGSQNSLSF